MARAAGVPAFVLLSVCLAVGGPPASAGIIPKTPSGNRPAGCSDFLEQRNIPLLPARFALLTATCREGMGPARRSSVRLHNCTGPVSNYRGQLACLTGRPGQLGPTNGTGRAQAGG